MGKSSSIYLWETEEAITAYLESDLKKSNLEAYKLAGPAVIQRYDTLDVLRE